MTTPTTIVAVPPKLPNQHNTLRGLVMAAGGDEGCDGDYRNYPVHVQDGVKELLGVAMMREIAVPVADDKPPTLPDAAKLCAVPPFNGARNATKHPPPPLFVTYMFSHEIELLEA
jgi:hypothetical protein